MRNLLLTLGHNSSAIMVEDNKIVWGYETERISGVKSDSRFPEAVLEHKNMQAIDMVYVTHWAPDGQLSSMSDKHWKPEWFDHTPIRTLSADRTHHDTHIYAAAAYAGHDLIKRPGTYGLVIDGFGTFGEHFSVYRFDGDKPVLIKRTHGYDTSLGLWYQYATAFMGMKMHEDEYKLLGYEVHAHHDAVQCGQLDCDADILAAEWLERMNKSVYGSKFDPMYNLSALAEVKKLIFDILTKVCKDYSIQDPTSYQGRCTLAYFVQAVLERVVMTVIRSLPVKNLVLSGGVFYNVKLNKIILDYVEGQLCVYPLAGDQGNALGLYAMDHPDFVIPDSLCWGQRNLYSVGTVPGLLVTNESHAKQIVQDQLRNFGFVNLVRGNMEFGPRAMCNTSTLARPTREVVDIINKANSRNTVMPMAPVMNMGMYHDLFERTKHLWKSYAHMIVAMEYQEHPEDDMLGIAHEYLRPYHHHTGRPQVISRDDHFMADVLDYMGTPLINTSFNYHGMPIAYDMESIIKNHMMQYQRDNRFFTVVIENE